MKEKLLFNCTLGNCSIKEELIKVNELNEKLQEELDLTHNYVFKLQTLNTKILEFHTALMQATEQRDVIADYLTEKKEAE